MFNRLFAPKDEQLEEAISSLYSDLAGHTGETEDASKVIDQLTKLYALKPAPVLDPNELTKTMSSIAIAVAVLKYEETGVITTKLFQFFGKMR